MGSSFFSKGPRRGDGTDAHLGSGTERLGQLLNVGGLFDADSHVLDDFDFFPEPALPDRRRKEFNLSSAAQKKAHGTHRRLDADGEDGVRAFARALRSGPALFREFDRDAGSSLSRW